MTNPAHKILGDSLNAPWTLQFDRDGTEDFGIICDANGNDLAASHVPCTRLAERPFGTGTFWLPEDDDDPTPLLVRQLCLMTAAPTLLAACKLALATMQQALEANDPQACTQMEWEAEPLATLRAAINVAQNGEPV